MTTTDSRSDNLSTEQKEEVINILFEFRKLEKQTSKFKSWMWIPIGCFFVPPFAIAWFMAVFLTGAIFFGWGRGWD